jgi:DNA invertase Pin-like site-specific DNA recombinase
MTTGKFIAYLRVSTDKQGREGLGIEAQRASITGYLNGGAWELLQEYVEVESGKTSNRPQLQEALKACKRTGAALVIAKLDRLSRDPDFLGVLMKSDIEFIACDMPDANKFMVRIMAALAEKEREMISERTRAALKAAKARGVKLGKPENATPEGRARGIAQSLEKRQEKSAKFAAEVLPMIHEYKAQGCSLRDIAAHLNASSTLTASGKCGSWTASAVKVILDKSST